MKSFAVILILGLLVLLPFSLILAAPQEYSIIWWTMDGGGGLSQGGDYAVHGTMGQPEASGTISGGIYSIQGGFWNGRISNTDGFSLFLPFILK